MATVALHIGERVLRNGLTVLAVQNPGVETFAATASLRVGRLDERSGEHGLSYLVGNCLEEGTRKRDGNEFAEAVENLGGAFESSESGGTIQCPAVEAAKALRLLREAVFEPAFKTRDVRRVQDEIVAEIEDDDSDPRLVARRRFRAEVYGDHPYGRPAYADAETIAGYRPADLERFHRRQFVPEEAIVALAGPMPVEESLDLASKAFRSFRGSLVPREPFAAPALATKRRDIHLPMDREQVHLFVGHLGVVRSDPDFHALLVMDHILGTGPGFTSRISRRLRDEQGLCYAVHAAITSNAGLQPGTFTAYIGTSAEHRQKAVDGFLDEMERLRNEPPSADELRDVHDYLTGSYVFGLERNANLVSYAIRRKRFGLPEDYLERYPELIRAVTADDVSRVARAHLHPGQVTVVSAGAG